MEQDREKWIQEVFDSVKDIKDVKAPEGMLDQIEKELDKPKVIPMKKGRLYLMAACIVGLLFANGSLCYQMLFPSRSAEPETISQLYTHDLVLDLNYVEL